MNTHAARRPVQGVLFDLDGTLLDTVDDLVHSANHALIAEGLPPSDTATLRSHVSGGARSMIGSWLVQTLESRTPLAYPALNVVEARHEDLFERVVTRMMDHYEQYPARHTRYFDGMETVLEHLDEQGIPWGIVTNKRERFTTPLAKAMGIDRRTACIVSGDTTAEAKPHPLPLLEASERLGINPEYCVYIGDAERDIEAGRRAGMRTLAALYGYINADDDIDEWGADDAIDSPMDLLTWMEQIST
jgi:N-acetyl-D-muramate 6-phosphate phosphatase